MWKDPFGSCCKALREALAVPAEATFRIEGDGVLFLTVGRVRSAEGTGAFDQAVIFCPFCGAQLQDPEVIRAQANASH